MCNQNIKLNINMLRKTNNYTFFFLCKRLPFHKRAANILLVFKIHLFQFDF